MYRSCHSCLPIQRFGLAYPAIEPTEATRFLKLLARPVLVALLLMVLGWSLVVASQTISDVVLVSDNAMLEASQWLWMEFGIAADLSGAASIAALQSGHPAFSGSRKICAIICGAGAEGTV